MLWSSFVYETCTACGTTKKWTVSFTSLNQHPNAKDEKSVRSDIASVYIADRYSSTLQCKPSCKWGELDHILYCIWISKKTTTRKERYHSVVLFAGHLSSWLITSRWRKGKNKRHILMIHYLCRRMIILDRRELWSHLMIFGSLIHGVYSLKVLNRAEWYSLAIRYRA